MTDTKPAQPQLILISCFRWASYCIRYFPTVNGGKPNLRPYAVQEYSITSNGKWVTLANRATFEEANEAYESAVQFEEATEKKRQLPEFKTGNNATTFDLPVPSYGLFSSASQLNGETPWL